MSATALIAELSVVGNVVLFFATILGLGWCVGVFQDWRDERMYRKRAEQEANMRAALGLDDDDHPTTEPRQDRGETHGGSGPSVKP